VSRRFGRWTYNSNSTRYGEAGWHLEGGPVVIDFMPDHYSQCPHFPHCRGEYQLHGWPGREWESVACRLREAMDVIEQEHDETVLAALAGESHASTAQS
jgi:uncharacterized protein (DUF2237 family)